MATVQGIYLALFGRPADPLGLAYFNSVTQNGANLSGIGPLQTSAEFQTRFSGQTNTQIITSIYRSLFNRDPDLAGLTFFANALTAGTLSINNIAIAIYDGARGDDITIRNLKEAAANAFTTAIDTVAEINGYSGTAAAQSGAAFIAGVTTTAPTAAQIDAAVLAATSTTAPSATFTLTKAVDFINGTGGNDLIIADNTAAAAADKQLSVADQINGGAGTDTLRIFLNAADTATGQPTLTSIENVEINGGAVVAYTVAAGVSQLTVDSPVVNTAATYTLRDGQSINLKNHNVTANTTTTIAAVAGSTGTSLNIGLDGQTKTGGVANTLDFSSTTLATLNVAATGNASNVSLTNTGTALKTINVTGDKGLTLTENAATAAAITTVDASKNLGGVSLNTSAGTVAATFKFTGGVGNDTLTLANDALGTLLNGNQLAGGDGTDKLGLFDTALSATETARINQSTGFEALGLNAAITLDASTLTSIKNFSIDTTALTQTINNLATGSVTTVTAAAPTSLTLGAAVGVNDTSVVLGTATSAGITVGTLVTTGITNVTITSNGTAANAITTLTNSDNSNFVLKGAQDLTLSLSAGTAVGSKIDGSGATGKLTLNGSSLTGSGDVIVGGAGADTINGLSGADKLTGGAGVDTFKFTSAAAANANGATFGTFDEITDFVIGTDKLQFTTADVVSGQQGAVQSAVSALAAGSSASAIATAMATASTTNLGVSFAVFEGNTYVLYETTGAGTGVVADDVFIKLTGVATLPTFAADVVA